MSESNQSGPWEFRTGDAAESSVTLSKMDGKPLLEFKSNGDAFYKGKLIGENTQDILQGLREFLEAARLHRISSSGPLQ